MLRLAKGMNSKRYIIRFENGAEDSIPASLCYTPSFSMKAREGIRFHFKWVHDFANGDSLYVETSEQESNKIWQENGAGE